MGENMNEMNWSKIIDGLQRFMIWVVIMITVFSILALIFFDVLAGTGVMMYLTNGDIFASITISLATTGLLMTLMLIVYQLAKAKKVKLTGVLIISIIVAVGVFGLDVFFDSLTADYLRFKAIISIDSLPKGDVHIYFRALIGGISSVGEPLGMAMIFGLPILKNVLKDVVDRSDSPTPKNRPTTPRTNGIPPVRSFRTNQTKSTTRRKR